MSFHKHPKPRAETQWQPPRHGPRVQREEIKSCTHGQKNKVDIKHASKFSPFHDSESQMKISLWNALARSSAQRLEKQLLLQTIKEMRCCVPSPGAYWMPDCHKALHPGWWPAGGTARWPSSESRSLGEAWLPLSRSWLKVAFVSWRLHYSTKNTFPRLL